MKYSENYTAINDFFANKFLSPFGTFISEAIDSEKKVKITGLFSSEINGKMTDCDLAENNCTFELDTQNVVIDLSKYNRITQFHQGDFRYAFSSQDSDDEQIIIELI